MRALRSYPTIAITLGVWGESVSIQFSTDTSRTVLLANLGLHAVDQKLLQLSLSLTLHQANGELRSIQPNTYANAYEPSSTFEGGARPSK